MKTLLSWSRMPSAWITTGSGLKRFRWEPGRGGETIAALTLYLVLVHHAEGDDGIARLSYQEFCHITGMSRDLVADGLRSLRSAGLIEPVPERRGHYEIVGFGNAPFAKVPTKPLYSSSRELKFAHAFSRRKQAVLDALKKYFLLAAFRDNTLNAAYIGYEKISDYSGVSRGRILKALTILATSELILVDHSPSRTSKFSSARGYRLNGLENYRHAATISHETIS